MSELYGLRLATTRHALAVLAEQGLIDVQQGRRAVVRTGAASRVPVRAPVAAQRTRHDCARFRCRPHVCKAMAPLTIRQIHAILSGMFGAAIRWEWIDRNPAASAKLPKALPRSPSSPEPDQVAKVIATARELGLELLALYLWLAAVTGARRGELCALQWADIDVERGVLHVAFSYLVLPGVKTRKDTKTHQARRLAIDDITVTVLADRRQHVEGLLAAVGCELPETAYIFTHDPAGATPWQPGW